jgi:hypothetical protein
VQKDRPHRTAKAESLAAAWQTLALLIEKPEMVLFFDGDIRCPVLFNLRDVGRFAQKYVNMATHFLLSRLDFLLQSLSVGTEALPYKELASREYRLVSGYFSFLCVSLVKVLDLRHDKNSICLNSAQLRHPLEVYLDGGVPERRHLDSLSRNVLAALRSLDAALLPSGPLSDRTVLETFAPIESFVAGYGRRLHAPGGPPANFKPELLEKNKVGYIRLSEKGAKKRIAKINTRQYRLVRALFNSQASAQYPYSPQPRTFEALFDCIHIAADEENGLLRSGGAQVASARRVIIENTVDEVRKIAGLSGVFSFSVRNGDSLALEVRPAGRQFGEMRSFRDSSKKRIVK